jgi:hypothetical protein
MVPTLFPSLFRCLHPSPSHLSDSNDTTDVFHWCAGSEKKQAFMDFSMNACFFDSVKSLKLMTLSQSLSFLFAAKK